MDESNCCFSNYLTAFIITEETIFHKEETK